MNFLNGLLPLGHNNQITVFIHKKKKFNTTLKSVGMQSIWLILIVKNN